MAFHTFLNVHVTVYSFSFYSANSVVTNHNSLRKFCVEESWSVVRMSKPFFITHALWIVLRLSWYWPQLQQKQIKTDIKTIYWLLKNWAFEYDLIYICIIKHKKKYLARKLLLKTYRWIKFATDNYGLETMWINEALVPTEDSTIT